MGPRDLGSISALLLICVMSVGIRAMHTDLFSKSDRSSQQQQTIYRPGGVFFVKTGRFVSKLLRMQPNSRFFRRKVGQTVFDLSNLHWIFTSDSKIYILYVEV